MRLILVLGLLLVSTIAYAGTRVQIEGRGSNEESAKQNALQSAIEQVVGQVIVSDQEVQGDRLTKDFIGRYSAGYVESYEILETRQEDDVVVVKMHVAVASSKIAQRMMSSGNKNMIIAGQQLQAQIDSQLDQRNRGDQLIAEVLYSYPYNALVINSGQTDIILGSHRQVYVDIPIVIQWSRFWLEALNETLTVTAKDSKSCNSWFAKQDLRIRLSSQTGLLGRLEDTPCGQEADVRISYQKSTSWFGETHSYYFHDRQTRELVNSHMQTPVGRQHIAIRSDIKDAGGRILASQCDKVEIDRLVSFTEPQFEVVHWNDRSRNLRMMIDGNARISGILRVDINKKIVNDISRINLTIEKTCA